MARFFGFVQFDFAGRLTLADGRYLAREGASGDESVLVVGTLGTTPMARRRRRRARQVQEAEPAELALTRVTAIRAFAAFDDEEAAARWLDEATEAEDTVDVLASDAVALLNRALHVQAVAATDPAFQALTAERATAVRIGYGSGEETADGRFSAAREVDVRGGASRRRRREEELRPQARVAAVLGGNERLDVCETLLLRARADLDGDREREAALQLRGGLEALLSELRAGPDDEGHVRDMEALRERRGESELVAAAAVGGELTSAQGHELRELLEICERVLRRRRVLDG
ncbi:MAG TPA: hypothetical protein VMS11_09950 [Solirubrobacterales bacterium]|nr:hypothetical protein [Solirubrobacterales bacterium]